MDEHGSPADVVVAFGMVSLVVLLVASLRWGLPDRWVVVLRRGVVRRVRERGPVPSLPLVERAVGLTTEPFEETVTARGRSAGGEEVRVAALVRAQALRPSPGDVYADPAGVVGDLVERVLVERIGRYDLHRLPAGLAGDLRTAAGPLDAAARARGVRLLELTPFSVEHLLVSPSVPHQCERPPGAAVAVR